MKSAKSVKSVKYSESVEKFLSDVREIQQLYGANYDLAHVKNQEDQDLEHAIEFSEHYKTRAKLSTQLHIVRVERRKAKNFVQDYQAVIDYLNKNKSVMDRLGILLGLLRKAEQYHPREYVPRVRDDYFKPRAETQGKIAASIQKQALQTCAEKSKGGEPN